MPSSGWLSALTRHLSRNSHTPTILTPNTAVKGVPTVSSQEADDGTPARSISSRPNTPWNLDTLDEEIQRGNHIQHNYHNYQGKAATLRQPPTTTTIQLHSPQPPRTTHLHYQFPQLGEVEVAAVSRMEGIGPASRPTSASSRAFPSSSSTSSLPVPSSTSSLPIPSSRPASASSRLSASAGHPILRTQAQVNTQPQPAASPVATLPAQVADVDDIINDESQGHYRIPPVIPPLYDRQLPGPTPTSTRCNTPLWDVDGEKRVRFLEPEVVADFPSRPLSANSQYSHIIKNSTRYAFQPMQPQTPEPGGHNLRFCNCPCHFFPMGRRSVGVQVKKVEQEPPRPRHYRLYFTPTTHGLDHYTLPVKSLSICSRALLSQVGLAVVVVVWWVVGAAIFSTVEGAAESDTINKMDTLRTDLVLGLATELRQVLPYEVVWRTKIELYMGRLEDAVLDAARAGYASRAPTWTMAGALLYSASLTTLVGPGGMTLRTEFSRVFAILFSLVGAPLVLLLAISGAYTVREGVGRAWAWRCGRGKQGKVSDSDSITVEGRAGNYGSGASEPGSTLNLARPQSSISQGGVQSQGQAPGVPRVTPNGPGELPGATVPGSSVPQSSRARHPVGSVDIHHPSRVPALDSTLRSSSFSSSSSREGELGVSNASQNIIPGSSQDQRTDEQQFVIQRRGKHIVPPKKRGKAVPWPVYLGILVAYIVLGLILFAPIQKWSFPSSLYIIFSTLLTLDHDALGERSTLGSSKIIIPYILYMVTGLVVIIALITRVWSSICSSLVNTGKYLAVVKPTPR